ncbi:MAG: RNA polymerase sigma factor [Armatimonadota bacterium]
MTTTDRDNAQMEVLWDGQREYMRRLLISLARNLDLAEDLLQETYLRARAGWPDYRGGDERAWLAAIARNVFLGYRRQRYVHQEVSFEDEPSEPWQDPFAEYGTLTELRQAVAALPPALRTALVMKHYAGYSYTEIAGRLSCSVSTTKWRVSTAIGRLRAILETPEEDAMTISTTKLLDYLYGALPEAEARRVRKQLDASAADRKELRALEHVAHALDSLEAEVKMVETKVLDAEGGVTSYFFLGPLVIDSPVPVEEADWQLTHGTELRCLLIDGQEEPVREVGRDEEAIYYKSPLPRTIPSGSSVLGPVLMITYTPDQVDVLESNRRRFCLGGQLGSDTENWIFVQAVHLPPGARLLRANPPADEVRDNTLTWRRTSAAIAPVAPGQWPLTGEVEYSLGE